MSGSFDRPGMPRRPFVPVPPEQDYAEFYAEDHPATAPPVPRPQQPPPYEPPAYEPPVPELHAPARGDAPAFEPGTTRIVPAGSVTSRSLPLVISIMCFLACLTAGAVYMINQQASAWMREIASEELLHEFFAKMQQRAEEAKAALKAKPAAAPAGAPPSKRVKA